MYSHTLPVLLLQMVFTTPGAELGDNPLVIHIPIWSLVIKLLVVGEGCPLDLAPENSTVSSLSYLGEAEADR